MGLLLAGPINTHLNRPSRLSNIRILNMIFITSIQNRIEAQVCLKTEVRSLKSEVRRLRKKSDF